IIIISKDSNMRLSEGFCKQRQSGNKAEIPAVKNGMLTLKLLTELISSSKTVRRIRSHVKGSLT
ncbi:MAG: hypothetical protein WAN11_19310, partial [Syntrophobacteraceae bacterium]